MLWENNWQEKILQDTAFVSRKEGQAVDFLPSISFCSLINRDKLRMVVVIISNLKIFFFNVRSVPG